MKYLIVGLGNIGPEYQNTRHNIGFKVLDAFAKASNAVFEDMRYGAVATVKLKGRTLILLKPNTYMNLSGKAVSYWMQKEKIELSNLFVVVDDLALPFGTIRLRGKGSDAPRSYMAAHCGAPFAIFFMLMTFLRGGSPKRRLYSLINCVALSYPTAMAACVTS